MQNISVLISISMLKSFNDAFYFNIISGQFYHLEFLPTINQSMKKSYIKNN